MIQITTKPLGAASENQTFALEENEGKLLLNGQVFDHDLTALSPTRFHLLHQHQSLNLEVLKADYANKIFVVRVNEHLYELTAKDRLDLLLTKMGMDNANQARMAHLKAPMPGLILDVKVEEGQTVHKGDPLLVLEAMKMENVLKASADATVKAVKVQRGENVDKNQVLIQFA